MNFLRWLGSIILLFWIIALIFKIGGYLINLLLALAIVIFILDALLNRKKSYK
ncbi:DUF5670 family protein [Haloimpatiens massiliensis]|uniref:DUF5670 family protein n=1 Tax=Haloimpatiens massiliensis TaxID=1658110 RepID=UPI0015E114D7|nr:DUF5670 family protein [Haloimpatiens massiliensis]